MISHKNELKEVHRVLNNIVITPDLYFKKLWNNDNGEMWRKLRPLYEVLDHAHPSTLYRLRSANERAIEAFENDALFLTRADHFNDPYDCLLYTNIEMIINNISEQLTKENLRNSVIRKIKIPGEPQDHEKIDEEVERIFLRKKEFISEVEVTLKNTEQMLQKNSYIVSYTEDVTSPVMWAHYADYHKGFALEYKYDDEYYHLRPHVPGDDNFSGYGWRSILPVKYTKERQDGSRLAEWFAKCEVQRKIGLKEESDDLSWMLPDMLLKTKLCLQKAKIWEYEKEWRMILTHEWPNHFGDPKIYFQNIPSAIYLGARMTKENEERLISIARDKAIRIFKMAIDPMEKEYKMICHEIEI